MDGYIKRENALMMFNRYFHNLKGNEAQVLVCDMKQAFLELPTADVVPKSEVERLEQILNSYALQYGTVKDQQAVIDKAKAEVLEEFEERIATHAFTSKSEDYSDGAFDTIAWVDTKLTELKKKYTEESNGSKQ